MGKIGIWTGAVIIFLTQSCGPSRPVKQPVQEMENLPTPQEIEANFQSANWSDRSNAVVDAIRIQYEGGKDAILRLLIHDSHPAVKATACVGAAHFQDARAGAIMLGYLKNPQCQIPDRVLVDALGQLKYRPATTTVVQYLANEDHTMRLIAVVALEGMGETGVCGQVLAMARKNSDPEFAKTFAMAMGKIPCRNSEDYLIQLAQKSAASPTLAASYLALGRIKSQNGISLLVNALEKEFPKGKENASIALREIQSPSSLPLLFAVIEKADKNSIWDAARVIPEIQKEKTRENSGKRAHALFLGKNPAIQPPVAYVLGHLQYKTATGDLLAYVRDPKAPGRVEVIDALGWMQDKSAVPELITILQEKSGDSRAQAALSLGYLNASEAIPYLNETSLSGDNKLAKNSIEALSMISAEGSLETLEKILKKDNEFSPLAASAIGSSVESRADEVLINEVEKGSPAKRKSILNAMAKRASEKYVDVLMRLVEKDDPDLRKAVYFSLKSITKKEYHARNQWLNWYVDYKSGKKQ